MQDGQYDSICPLWGLQHNYLSQRPEGAVSVANTRNMHQTLQMTRAHVKRFCPWRITTVNKYARSLSLLDDHHVLLGHSLHTHTHTLAEDSCVATKACMTCKHWWQLLPVENLDVYVLLFHCPKPHWWSSAVDAGSLMMVYWCAASQPAVRWHPCLSTQ